MLCCTKKASGEDQQCTVVFGGGLLRFASILGTREHSARKITEILSLLVIFEQICQVAILLV